jgi:hypothetical protein
MRHVLLTATVLFTLACGDSTGVRDPLSGSWIDTNYPPGNGWTIDVNGNDVRGTAWLDMGDTGALTGVRRGDSLFLTFDAQEFLENGVSIAARVVGDTISGYFANERSPVLSNLRLVRTTGLPSGYVDLSIRGAATLDYRGIPGRFSGSSQSGFTLMFATFRRVPNVTFVLEGGGRPPVGRFSIGPGSANPYHASGGAGGGSLDAVSGTLTITRSTALALTGTMRYESIDPFTRARTTVAATFDLPCTDNRSCRP